MATYQTFIAVFPEFQNVAACTTDSFAYWIAQAPIRISARRLGAQFDLASMLYVAHNLALSANEMAVAAKGGVPGDSLGPISSKSVGGVSVSYDAGSISIAGAGEWNATSYGQRLYKLIKAASMGGVYCAPPPRSHSGGFGGGRGGGGWF